MNKIVRNMLVGVLFFTLCSGAIAQTQESAPSAQEQVDTVKNMVQQLIISELQKLLREESPRIQEKVEDLREEIDKRAEKSDLKLQMLEKTLQSFSNGEALFQASPEKQAPPNAHDELESLDHEQQLLAEQIRATEDPAEREALQGELRAKLKQRFHLAQEMRAAELQQLEAEARRKREVFELRESHREEIIERRMRDLLEGNYALTW